MDKLKDRRRSNLWMIDTENSRHRPLTSGNNNYGYAQWSTNSVWIVFTMFMPKKARLIVSLTGKPEGAKWAKPARAMALLHDPVT